MDRQTYEQLDRIEQNQEEIMMHIDLIKQKLGILEEQPGDDDTEDF